MRIWKAVFSVLTIAFGSVALMKWLPSDIALPAMFVFMGLAMLTNAKECYDKGAKRDAAVFICVAVFIYAVTAYNIITRIVA